MLKADAFSVGCENGVFTVLRDGKPLRSPQGKDLSVSYKALAEKVVEEFARQSAKMDVRAMPFTQMVLTMLDVSSTRRSEIVESLVRFGETELLCVRASEPQDLCDAQARVWQPYLDWAREALGAELKVGCGIMPFEQSREAVASLRRAVEALDAYRLTALSHACSTLGSLVLGLALVCNKASAEDVFDAAELDALWQSRKWGDDPATEKRWEGIKKDLELCAAWLVLSDA